MRRSKRATIIRIGLALAALAIPATAQAKVLDSDDGRTQYQLGPAEIPYLSHGVGVTAAELGIPSSAASPGVRGEAMKSRAATSNIGEPATVATEGGVTIDANPYAVTGFGLAVLLAIGGIGVAIRHSRRDGLAPA